MACTLLTSLRLDCRDSVGGVAEIKVKVHPGATTMAADFSADASGVVTIASGSQNDWFQYDLEKFTANFSTPSTVSQENGTFVFDQMLSFVANKLTVTLLNEIRLLGQNRLLFAIKDNNGVYYLMGYDFGGADMETSPFIGTGTKQGDRNGAQLQFRAQAKYVYTISAATYATL